MCSWGCGLLLFKIGVFYVVIVVGVLIIFVCVFNIFNKVNLNCLNNGLVIVEMLLLVDVSEYGKDQVCELVVYCCVLME